MAESKIEGSTPNIKTVTDENNFVILNMIVKNESHVITETLTNLVSYIKISYYVIVDTGSTDDTEAVIKQFFDALGIPGKIIKHDYKTCTCHGPEHKKHKFFDFGKNRTYAMKHCLNVPFDKTKYAASYIFVFDADDLICGNFKLPKLVADSYMVDYGQGFTYKRTQLFRNIVAYNWRYEHALHEYPTCDLVTRKEGVISGDYHIESRRLGDRNKNPNKYKDDADVFDTLLEEEPDNERYVFYGAQSHCDGGNYTKAIELYKKRIELGRWYEEVFYSYAKLGDCMTHLKMPWCEIEKVFLDGYNFCKIRGPEVLFKIANYYRNQKDYKNGYKYAKMGAPIPFPTQCVLFLHKDIYDFTIHDELAVNAYHLEKYYESYSINKRLIDTGVVPEDHVERIKQNMYLSKLKLDEKDKRLCVIYCANEFVGTNNSIIKIASELTKLYKILLVGDHFDTMNIHNLMMTTVDNFKTIMNNLEVEYLILYNSLNYFYDSIKLSPTYIYLIQEDNFLKRSLVNRSVIAIYNNEYLNTVFNKINKIICLDRKQLNKLANDYKLETTTLTLMDPFLDTEYYKLFDDQKQSYSFKALTNMENRMNNLLYIEPGFVSQYLANKRIAPFTKDLLYLHNNQAIKQEPNVPEHYYKLALLNLDMDDTITANFNLDNAMKNLKPNLNSHKSFKDIIVITKAEILHKNGKYMESYNMANEVLNRNLIPNSIRCDLEKIRDCNIDHIKDQYQKYPAKQIMEITKDMATRKKYRVVLSMTTCKRFDLFERTVNSFINCCLDYSQIDNWLCVDDNSSEEDRIKMRKLYPFFTYIMKDESQKGHFASMNIIHQYVSSPDHDITYLLHMEDDWQYVQKRCYIGDAIKIMGENKRIGQVLFNRNYAEIEDFKQVIRGGHVQVTKDNTRYVMHEHYPTGTPEYEAFVNKHSGFGTCGYWPHFSFRPSVLRVSTLRDVGIFYNTGHFEMQYANEYNKLGYKSVFLDTFACIHIGKKTWEKSGINSYNLNKTGQFTLTDELLTIYVKSDDNDSEQAIKWKLFKEQSLNKLPYYTRYAVKNIETLDAADKKMFLGNKFNYMRAIISPIRTYLQILRDVKSRYILFLDQTVKFDADFAARSKQLINFLKKKNSNYDLIYMGDQADPVDPVDPDAENTDNLKLTKVSKKYDTFESFGMHIISKEGIGKIFEYIDSHPIIDHHSYLNNLKMDTYILNKKLFEYEPDIKIIDPKTLYTELPGYQFYSGLDSYGNDIGYFHEKTVQELREICDNGGGKGFNTLGYVKKEVGEEKDYIYLINSTTPGKGFYRKLDDLDSVASDGLVD